MRWALCAFLLSRHKFAALLSGLSWGLGRCLELPWETAVFSAFPFVDRAVGPGQGLLVCALQRVLGLSCSQQTRGESLVVVVAVWLMVLRGSSSVV